MSAKNAAWALISIAAIFASPSECRAADVFAFDTPAAKRAEKNSKPKERPAPARGVANFVVAADDVRVQLFDKNGLPAPAVGGNDDDVRKQRVNLLLATYLPRLKVELSLLNRVAKLDDAQRRDAVAAAKKAVHDKVSGVVGDPQQFAQLQQGGWIIAQGQMNIQTRPVDDVLAEAIADAVKTLLHDRQRNDYERELARRREFSKQAVIANVVAQLDELLVLEPRQREAIAASLEDGWNDEWAPSIGHFVQFRQYLPEIPEDRVAPHLSREQEVVWRGAQKATIGGQRDVFQNIFMGPAPSIDDLHVGDEP